MSDITVTKLAVRGKEAMYLVARQGKPIGYVTKFKDDRHTRNPWKAYRYVGTFVPGATKSEPMGHVWARGQPGLYRAVDAIARGIPVTEDPDFQ